MEITAEQRQAAQEARRRRSADRKARGVPGLRAAINAMCRGCIYDSAAGGTARQQIIACRVTACPLWLVRPGAD